jgi:hypothetical protein
MTTPSQHDRVCISTQSLLLELSSLASRVTRYIDMRSVDHAQAHPKHDDPSLPLASSHPTSRKGNASLPSTRRWCIILVPSPRHGKIRERQRHTHTPDLPAARACLVVGLGSHARDLTTPRGMPRPHSWKVPSRLVFSCFMQLGGQGGSRGAMSLDQRCHSHENRGVAGGVVVE